MMALAVVLEAFGAPAPAAFGVGGDGGGLQGVREERIWVGSDAGLPGGGVAQQGPSDGGHQHGVEVLLVVRAAHASAARQAETLRFTINFRKENRISKKMLADWGMKHFELFSFLQDSPPLWIF